MEAQPIDAVITWVDGSDPRHASKLTEYLATLGIVRPRAANPLRFYHSGELDYCVTSLLKFAPWIRTIFIVTDDQMPSLMKDIEGTIYRDRIKVIDHKIIFAGFERYLPSFNSSSILAVLWRIPGLAERFIFLNDDFALIRPVKPQDFFRGNNVVLRGQWRKFSELTLSYRIKQWLKRIFLKKLESSQMRAGYLAGQELSAKKLGFATHYFQIPHNPHAWQIRTLQQYFADNPDVLDFSVSFQLRSSEQYIVESLAAHLALKHERAVIDNNLTTLQLKPATQATVRIKRKLVRADKNTQTAFVCVQSIELAPTVSQELIFSWLDQRIGSLSELIKQTEGQ